MRGIKKLFLLFVLIFSLSSCGDNYYDDSLINLPTTNSEIRIERTNYLDAFEIEVDFKNTYDVPIEYLYITYGVVDRYNYPLIDRRTNRKVQQVLVVQDLLPGEEYTFKMPYLFYNPYCYKGKLLGLTAKFQE